MISAPNHRSRGSEQSSWTPGLAKPGQGGKREANGEKLAFIRAVQAFSCHGASSSSAACQFKTSNFHITHRFFVTFFTEESNVLPRLKNNRPILPQSAVFAQPHVHMLICKEG